MGRSFEVGNSTSTATSTARVAQPARLPRQKQPLRRNATSATAMRCAMLKPQVAEALLPLTALPPCPPIQLDPQSGSALGMSPLTALAMGVATTPVATGRVSHAPAERCNREEIRQHSKRARQVSLGAPLCVAFHDTAVVWPRWGHMPLSMVAWPGHTVTRRLGVG